MFFFFFFLFFFLVYTTGNLITNSFHHMLKCTHFYILFSSRPILCIFPLYCFFCWLVFFLLCIWNMIGLFNDGVDIDVFCFFFICGEKGKAPVTCIYFMVQAAKIMLGLSNTLLWTYHSGNSPLFLVTY